MATTLIYDTIAVQEHQCILDIALQYYGTADPQAIIMLVEDNKLDNVTATIQQGDILYIRKSTKNININVINFYKSNNIIPATANVSAI